MTTSPTRRRSLIDMFFPRYAAARRHARLLHELRDLDDHLLRDIGLNPGDVLSGHIIQRSDDR
jgi:uncharacterized protein YjiS (DUF1127 family)